MGQPRLDGPELLHNGGFEAGDTSSWNITAPGSSSGSFDVSTTAVYQGGYSAVVSVNSIGTIWQPRIEHIGADFADGDKLALEVALSATASKFIPIFLTGSGGFGDDVTNTQTLTTYGDDAFHVFNATFVVSGNPLASKNMIRFGMGADYTDVKVDFASLRAYLELNPDYGYKFEENQERRDIRTRAGALYTYIEDWGFTRFKLPLSWVSSYQRSLINSWWKTGADLRWIENDDYPNSYHNVRIVGKEEPFQSFHKPYFSVEYRGEIVLETI